MSATPPLPPTVVEGYIGKSKGALQIACKRVLIDLEEKLVNGIKSTMGGTLLKDLDTGVTSIDKTTSLIRMLGKHSDFSNEKTQLMYIMDLLGVSLILTPKFHPKIAGREVEYAWGYSKLRF